MNAINQSPGLVKSVFLEAPFLDILGLLKNPSQYLAESDYDEFGDPSVKQEFESIYSLCPYNNIKSDLFIFLTNY
jgi:oligopeptidase B